MYVSDTVKYYIHNQIYYTLRRCSVFMTLIETLFYKADESTNQMRISKTKVITCIVFIVFFILAMIVYTDQAFKDTNIIILLLSAIVFGLIFAVPTFIVGWLIGKLLNRNKAKNYSNTTQDYNPPLTQNNIDTQKTEKTENSLTDYAKEFKEAVESDNVDLASQLLLKWDKNDANYRYASLIFDGMPPTQLSLTEMNEMLKTADNMNAYDESLKGWYRTTSLEVINLNKE